MALLEVRKDGLRLGILVQMRLAHHQPNARLA